MIRIEDLTKSYPDATPLKDLSVTINDKDVVAIIGPSGTGKSTLLRCINLLEKPSSGHIWIDDEEITAKDCDINKIRQKLGMVFQNFNLFDHLTVIENIMFSPVTLKNMDRQEAFDKAMELLKMVGLAEKIFSYPDELSGGQKQRIAIARALAMDPEIIMFDEPTSALDPTMVNEVESVISKLADMGKTMIIVTHEMNFARAISNRVFYMDEGAIYEEGSPEEIFDNPKRDNTRRFIHNLKVLTLWIGNRNYDFLDNASKIERYANKNQIPYSLMKRLLLVYEEVSQLLIKTMDDPKIEAICEYDENNKQAVWTFNYGKKELDITEKKDDLSLKVIEGISEDISYSVNKDQPLINRLELKVKDSER